MAYRSAKAQFSLEYLTTYGWALILLLAVAVILFWLGVINPRVPVSSTCFFPADIGCKGFALNASGYLTLDIGQATGHSIRVSAMKCTQETTPTLIPLATPVTITNGAHAYITDGSQQCYNSTGGLVNGTAGSIYKGRVFVRYDEVDTGFPHQVVGEVVLKYEEITVPTATPTPVPTATPTPGPGTCDSGCACFQPVIGCVVGSVYDTICPDKTPPCEYAAGQPGICCKNCADDPLCACVTAPAGCAAIGQQDCSWSPTTAPCYLMDNSKKCCKPLVTPTPLGSFNGTITVNGGAGIAGAAVTAVGPSSATNVTITGGNYYIYNLAPGGPYTVSVTHPNYTTNSSSPWTITSGATTTVNLWMKPTPTPAPSVTPTPTPVMVVCSVCQYCYPGKGSCSSCQQGYCTNYASCGNTGCSCSGICDGTGVCVTTPRARGQSCLCSDVCNVAANEGCMGGVCACWYCHVHADCAPGGGYSGGVCYRDATQQNDYCGKPCSMYTCGDGYCDQQETSGSCPADCPVGKSMQCGAPGCTSNTQTYTVSGAPGTTINNLNVALYITDGPFTPACTSMGANVYAEYNANPGVWVQICGFSSGPPAGALRKNACGTPGVPNTITKIKLVNNAACGWAYTSIKWT